MSALEFISSLIWPLLVLGLFLVMRPTIVRALTDQRLSRFKAGPVEVAWEQALSSVEVELDRGPGTRSATPAPTSLQDELTPLLAVSPPSAVMESFVRVEKALRGLVELSSPSDELSRVQLMSGTRLARVAHDRKLISDETLSAIRGLAVLRNMAAHGHIPEDMNRERALEYVALADAVLFAIDQERKT